MSWNCNTFRRRDVLQSPLATCQIPKEDLVRKSLCCRHVPIADQRRTACGRSERADFAFPPQGSRRKPAQRLRWEEEGQRSAVSFGRRPKRTERTLRFPHRAPITNQRSVCDGKRRSKGASAVFAISRRLTAETETSGLCFDDRGVYRFRRGYGGGTSGRRRLTAIKRAIYKSNNNRQVAIAA